MWVWVHLGDALCHLVLIVRLRRLLRLLRLIRLCQLRRLLLTRRLPHEPHADAELAAGGHALVHCHASLSRSVAFVLAYLMKTRSLTAAEAAALMKEKWTAVWPNDTFVLQLLKYEDDLKAAK